MRPKRKQSGLCPPINNQEAPQSDQKIQTSELRVKLSERVGLLPAQVDLFCIHYLGKTPFVRRKSAKESNKPLET